ncbi:MAG: WecB/TagA/CpsF family glycosyltransferase, partial [Desulfobacteraceae bacterium]|nr:WecB/TagA/CpsF family glycosyltransferase [Desulfobacteraceae bacterium]
LYGSKEEVSNKAADILKEKYPDLIISGRSNGYVPESKMNALVTKINDSGADILFMAFGSPRQEKWFTKYSNSLKNIKICQGVGGSLDVVAGNVKRSPDIWIKYNVEWLYRLLAEPKRIKRQIVLPVFAMKIILKKIKRKLECLNG